MKQLFSKTVNYITFVTLALGVKTLLFGVNWSYVAIAGLFCALTAVYGYFEIVAGEKHKAEILKLTKIQEEINTLKTLASQAFTGTAQERKTISWGRK